MKICFHHLLFFFLAKYYNSFLMLANLKSSIPFMEREIRLRFLSISIILTLTC